MSLQDACSWGKVNGFDLTVKAHVASCWLFPTRGAGLLIQKLRFLFRSGRMTATDLVYEKIAATKWSAENSYRSMEVDTRKTSTHWQNPSISKLLAIIASGVFGFFNRIFLPNMLFDSNLFSPTRGDIHFLFLCLHCTDVWKSGIVQRWSGAGLGGLACAAALGKAIGSAEEAMYCWVARSLWKVSLMYHFTSQNMFIIINFTIQLTLTESLFFWGNLWDGFFWWHWWMFLVLAEGRAEGLGCRSAFGVRWLCTMVALQGNSRGSLLLGEIGVAKEHALKCGKHQWQKSIWPKFEKSGFSTRKCNKGLLLKSTPHRDEFQT